MKHLCYIATALLLLLIGAVTAQAEDKVTYTQVTQQSEIVAGGKYILVVERIIDGVENTFYANSFVNPNFLCSTKIDPSLVLTLYSTDKEGTFFLKDATRLFHLIDSGSLAASGDTASEYRYWTITIADDGQIVMKVGDKNFDPTTSKSRLFYSGGTNRYISYGSGKAASNSSLYLYRVTTPAQKVSVTVSELGYSTFCCDKALDFANSSITAYTLTLNGTDIALNTITKVPANTGVLLYKEGGATEDIDVCTDELESITGNALSAVSSTYTVGDDERIYVLSAFDGVVAFYRAEAGLELPVGKAYITLPDDDTNAKCLSFSQLLPTALTTANTPVSQRPGYNIHGQRVDDSYRGIVITDGKKRITSR